MKSRNFILIWSVLLVSSVISFFYLWNLKDKKQIDLSKSTVTIQGRYTDSNKDKHESNININLKSEISKIISSDSISKLSNWHIIQSANKNGDIVLLTDNYDGKTKLPLSIIELLIVIIVSIGTVSVTKVIQFLVDNTRFKHIRNNHEWLLDFGLSRVHAAKDDASDFDYYISYLNLLTKGFEELNRDKLNTNKISIKLFYPDTVTGIIENYTKGDIQRLYAKWNELAKNDNYEIDRFFITDKLAFCSQQNKTSYSEYSKLFPNIKPYFIDKERISVIVNKLENRLDMAIFQCSTEYLCIGFKRGEITYIVNNLENGRSELFNHALQLESEYGTNTVQEKVFNLQK